MGYIVVIIAAIILIPILYIVFSSRAGKTVQGERPIGKPVMVEEPASDEPTPAASSTRRDTTQAQRKTPPA